MLTLTVSLEGITDKFWRDFLVKKKSMGKQKLHNKHWFWTMALQILLKNLSMLHFEEIFSSSFEGKYRKEYKRNINIIADKC